MHFGEPGAPRPRQTTGEVKRPSLNSLPIRAYSYFVLRIWQAWVERRQTGRCRSRLWRSPAVWLRCPERLVMHVSVATTRRLANGHVVVMASSRECEGRLLRLLLGVAASLTGAPLGCDTAPRLRRSTPGRGYIGGIYWQLACRSPQSGSLAGAMGDDGRRFNQSVFCLRHRACLRHHACLPSRAKRHGTST